MLRYGGIILAAIGLATAASADEDGTGTSATVEVYDDNVSFLLDHCVGNETEEFCEPAAALTCWGPDPGAGEPSALEIMVFEGEELPPVITEFISHSLSDQTVDPEFRFNVRFHGRSDAAATVPFSNAVVGVDDGTYLHLEGGDPAPLIRLAEGTPDIYMHMAWIGYDLGAGFDTAPFAVFVRECRRLAGMREPSRTSGRPVYRTSTGMVFFGATE